MMYTPKFYVTERDGKRSYWVSIPDGGDWNIWDVKPKQDTPEIRKALISAFERGFDACNRLHSKIPTIYTPRVMEERGLTK